VGFEVDPRCLRAAADCSDELSIAVGEDADDAGAAFDLGVESLV
jgi:hypothetical protein